MKNPFFPSNSGAAQPGPLDRFGYRAVFPVLILLLGIIFFVSASTESLTRARSRQTDWKEGERLTYSISFNNEDSVGYAEIRVVSKGKLNGKDAIELRAKLKTVGHFSAANFLWDETRTTFVSQDTGFPLYVRHVSDAGILPREIAFDYLKTPSSHLDLLSLIYKARESAGIGSFSVVEFGRVFNFDLSAAGGETVVTDAGEFETTLSNVESSYLSENYFKNFRVNFSTDDRRLPVLIRFNTPRGEFAARLASIQDLEPETGVTPSVTPAPVPTVTPTPEPSPEVYVDNRRLSADLPFALGESLEYRVSRLGEEIAGVVLRVKERKLFRDQDSLLLTATVHSVAQGNTVFAIDDKIEAWVDPETLAPVFIDLRFGGGLNIFNQSATFDQQNGKVNLERTNQVEVPVGTHSILSLAYAVRSFNLRPGVDPQNPVNDTRVAVFYGSSATVLTLRPSTAETIEFQGRRVSAQPVSIRTGNPSIDAKNLKIWLSNDARRLPIRLTFSEYQADLVTLKQTNP